MRREISIRRKLRVSIFIICVLLVCLKNVYDDKTFIEHDISLYQVTSCYKDTAIMNLYRQIDSLEKFKPKPVIIYIKPVYKKKVEPILMTKDTLENIQNVDTTYKDL